jgi:hypothetical protein
MSTKKRLEPAEVLRAISESSSECAAVAQARNIGAQQAQAEILAGKLKISVSHAYYLLRTKSAPSSANQSQAPAAPINTAAPAINTPAPSAPSAEPAESINILRTHVDASAFIPPKDKAYKMRDVDQDIEKYAERRDYATVIVGEAGSGKTYAVQQYAARHGLPFLRVACDDSVALRELLGRREIKQGTTFFKFGLLLEFLQKPGVVLFDEFNALPSGKLFFLHEILDKMSDGHRVFVKEADCVITLHKDCRIFLACNPNSAKYSGTNKLNVALADRPRIVHFEPFAPSEIKEFFDCGDKAKSDALKSYFVEARKLIQSSSMRAVFSLRSIKRIAESIKNGDAVEKALEHNFYNMTLLTASEAEREQLFNLAKVCFGLNVVGAVKQ